VSRFNTKGTPTVGPKSAVVSTGETVRNHEGGTGYLRDSKSELFLLAASFMGGDDNFYEKSDGRYNRLVNLVGQDAVIGDPDWVMMFVNWLRNEANMRTVAMVIALETVRIRVSKNMTESWFDMAGDEHTNRDIVSVALNRGDEPAEAIAYWLAKHGKMIPWPVRNGVADAAIRLYNEYSYLKYGKSRSASVGMIDVLRLTHPKPKDEKQSALFALITKGTESDALPMVTTRKWLYSIPTDQRQSYIDGDSDSALAFKNAGLTWENLSEWLPNGMDAKGWELAIPNMGVMALIRNLRNFDQAGISRESVRFIQDKLNIPEVILKSRQLPFRWYNAYRATDSVRWSDVLENALDISLANIPKFRGKTLVLVDMSGSMFQSKVSDRSNVTYADVASLFGAAIALRDPDNVDVFQYGSEFANLVGRYVDSKGIHFSSYSATKRWTGVTQEVKINRGASLLRAMDKFHDMGGTETHVAFAELNARDGLSKYNRIILLSDEQSFGWGARRVNYDELPVPAGTNLYIWNLAGYQAGTSASGRYHRHTFGGLSDAAFKLIPILEAGKNAGWPWEVDEVPVSNR
jgi:hypothetical protein